MVAGSARPAHRLSAAGRRTAGRHGGAEYRALRATTPNPKAIIAAAKAAGVHDLIVKPAAKATRPQVGENGTRAVGRPGAAHRAGARALSRSVPGGARRAQLQSRCRRRRGAERARSRACASAAASSSSIAHRPSAIAGVDLLLVMNQGRVQQAFGPKDEVLAQGAAAAVAGRRAAQGRPRSRERQVMNQHEPKPTSAAQPRSAGTSLAGVVDRRRAGRRRRRLGRHHDSFGRADRAGPDRGRFQRQEGAAPDRRHRRRSARARRRPRQASATSWCGSTTR